MATGCSRRRVHRIAAARSLGLLDVLLVMCDADIEDVDRAVKTITSCRCRHDGINADRVVMPTSRCDSSHVWREGAARPA
jgi:hypothetical protein